MDIKLKLLLAAVLIQFGLTLWALLATGRVRLKALKSTDLSIADIALSKTAYPEDVQKQQNNLQNQFETPILFYIAVALIAALGVVNWVMVGAAIAFVGLRFWHRRIHITHNHVIKRFNVFLYGLFALTILWGALAVEVLLA